MTESSAVVLIAVDLSEASGTVLEAGLRAARALQAEALIVHVVHRLDAIYGVYVGAGSVGELQHDLEETGRVELSRLFEDHCRDCGVRCTDVLLRGTPWSQILDQAERRRVDWIVVGAHVREKPEHGMLGSTATRVLTHAACPVLVVPPEPGASGSES